MFDIIDHAAVAAAPAGFVCTDDGPLRVYTSEGSHFRLRVTVEVERAAGVEFRLRGPQCRSLEYGEDTDSYPVTGPRFGPIAHELALDFAAWIRAFAERRLLVGCRRGNMLFTVPLHEQRLVAWRGRILSRSKRVPLGHEQDDFSDLVPVQEWPPNTTRLGAAKADED